MSAGPLNYRPITSAIFYTPAKRFNSPRAIRAVACAILAAAVGGFLYGKAEPELLNLEVRLAGVACAAVATGLLGAVVVRYGKVSSPAIAVLIGTSISLIALYSIWISWEHDALIRRLRIHVPYQALIIRPRALYVGMHLMNAVGVWSYEGDTPTGFLLAIFWLGEAAAVIGCGVVIPMKAARPSDPICLECSTVCKFTRGFPRFDATEQTTLVSAVENREFVCLENIPALRNVNDPEVSLLLYSCPQCRQTNVLTVNRIAWGRDRQGKRAVAITPLLNQLLISSDEAINLVEACNRTVALRKEGAAARIAMNHQTVQTVHSEQNPGQTDAIDTGLKAVSDGAIGI